MHKIIHKRKNQKKANHRQRIRYIQIFIILPFLHFCLPHSKTPTETGRTPGYGRIPTGKSVKKHACFSHAACPPAKEGSDTRRAAQSSSTNDDAFAEPEHSAEQGVNLPQSRQTENMVQQRRDRLDQRLKQEKQNKHGRHLRQHRVSHPLRCGSSQNSAAPVQKILRKKHRRDQRRNAADQIDQ